MILSPLRPSPISSELVFASLFNPLIPPGGTFWAIVWAGEESEGKEGRKRMRRDTREKGGKKKR